MPRIETLTNVPAELKAQTGGAMVPPGIRTAVGTGDSGGNGDIPPGIKNSFDTGDWKEIPTDREIDTMLFFAIGEELKKEINDRTREPWLMRDLDISKGLNSVLNGAVEPVSNKGLREFIDRAKEEGLIRKGKGLSLRQYIGALTALNPFKKR